MGAEDIIGALLGKVDSMGIRMVQTMYDTLAVALQPVFLLGMTCFVVWWGYEMLFGRAQMTAGAFVWRFGKLIMIYAFIFSWSTYQPLVVKPLVEAPNAVATVICMAAGGASCGKNGASISQGLTDIWNAGFEASTTIANAAGITGVALMFLAYILLGCVIALIAVAVVLLMIGKMTMFMLLAIGPIILCCAIFDFTSHITDGWVRTLSQFALLPVVVYGLLGMMILLLQDSITALQGATGDPDLNVIGPFILMCVITLMVLKQSLNITMGIAGGVRMENTFRYSLPRLKAKEKNTGDNRNPSINEGSNERTPSIGQGSAQVAQIVAAARDARR